VLDGGGSVENLDRTAKKFLDYLKKFETSSLETGSKTASK